MIRPTSFAFHVTYTCPLRCAHCCFSSSPANRDRLELEMLHETIDALDPSIAMVAFTGGEPFLLGRQLVSCVYRASQRGFVTRIVTSGFFGRSPAAAERRLREVREAGLSELSISWDDFHEEFVGFECVRNTFRAAKELGLSTAINMVQVADAKWTSERVREELGADPSEIVAESPLNLTGRAREQLRDRPFVERRLLGPCPYVVTGPTLSARNKLLACCGVVPETRHLVLEHDFRPEKLAAAIERGRRSALLTWIYLRGPFAIAEWISRRFDVAIPKRTELGGNCEACRLLFESRELAAHIEEAVEEKATQIWAEVELMASLGLLEPSGVLALWADDRAFLDITPRGSERAGHR